MVPVRTVSTPHDTLEVERDRHSAYKRELTRKGRATKVMEATDPKKRPNPLKRRELEIFLKVSCEEGYQAKKAGYTVTIRPLPEHQSAAMDAWVSELTSDDQRRHEHHTDTVLRRTAFWPRSKRTRRTRRTWCR